MWYGPDGIEGKGVWGAWRTTGVQINGEAVKRVKYARGLCNTGAGLPVCVLRCKGGRLRKDRVTDADPTTSMGLSGGRFALRYRSRRSPWREPYSDVVLPTSGAPHRMYEAVCAVSVSLVADNPNHSKLLLCSAREVWR